MKHFKRLYNPFIKLLFLNLILCSFLWVFIPKSFAGGGEYYSAYYVENGFNILFEPLSPFKIRRTSSFSSHVYSNKEYTESNTADEYNIATWSEFLKLSKGQAKAIVYKGQDSDALPNEVKNYLKLVRQQEPLVDYSHSWDRESKAKKQPRDEIVKPYNAAISEAEAQLKSTKTPFLRQRLAFLAIRLAHYSGQYDKTQQLYNTYKADTAQPNAEVAHWITSLKAGALKRQGKKAEAAYLFAKVFSKTKTRQLQAHVNFVIKTDEEWKALLDLCQNDEEKALMHFMRALKSNANSLQELNDIYRLAPNSPWVDALMVRELEFVQFAKQDNGDRLSNHWQGTADINTQLLIDDVNRYQRKGSKPPSQQKLTRRADYLKQLSEIIKSIKQDQKRTDLFITDFAELYLKLLTQQSVTIADINAFQKTYASDKRTPYTKGLEYFVYLENLASIDSASEDTLSNYLTQIRSHYGDNEWTFKSDIMDYTYIKLQPLYKASKQVIKEYVSKRRGHIDLDEMIVAQLRDMKALLKQKDTNFLIKHMTESMRITVSEHPADEAIARKYLSAGMYDKALESLNKVPDQQHWKSVYNPFTTSLSGNNRTVSTPKDLKTIINTLITLNKSIENNPKDANAHFLLATAHYNMSWFGNTPMALRYHRSTYSWKRGEINQSKAKKHYQLALDTTNSRELKAKALYALAKIETNELGIQLDLKDRRFGIWPNPYDTDGYLTTSYSGAVQKRKQKGLGEYFDKIKPYEDTQYFNDVIKQCADYRFYTNQ